MIFNGITTLAAIFTEPMYIPVHAASLLWALPICFCIATVYKAVKLEEFEIKVFIRETIFLFITIIGFLVFVAICLLVIAKLANVV